MAKTGKSIFVFSPDNLLCLVGISHGAEEGGGGEKNNFTVHGKVYCDTCRIQFVTRVSETLKVKLECKNLTTGVASSQAEAQIGDLGLYKFEVEGDHEDDICEVGLVKSPTPDVCSEIGADVVAKQAAMVSLTSNNGQSSGARYANPLGFLKKELLPECPKVLKELDLNEDDDGGEEGVGHDGAAAQEVAPATTQS